MLSFVKDTIGVRPRFTRRENQSQEKSRVYSRFFFGRAKKSAPGEPGARFWEVNFQYPLLLQGHHGSRGGFHGLGLLLAGNQSGSRKGENSDGLHNYLTSFDLKGPSNQG